MLWSALCLGNVCGGVICRSSAGHRGVGAGVRIYTFFIKARSVV